MHYVLISFLGFFKSLLKVSLLSIAEVDSGGGAGGAPSFFLESLVFFFCNHFEELQTVLFEVELIINNVPLTIIYPNTNEIYFAGNFYILQTEKILYNTLS